MTAQDRMNSVRHTPISRKYARLRVMALLPDWAGNTSLAPRAWLTVQVNSYPKTLTPTGHVAPVPRRIRAMLGGEVVLDTTAALYVWEWPNYPQYYIPVADVKPGVLVDEQHVQKLRRGTARRHGLRAGDISR